MISRVRELAQPFIAKYATKSSIAIAWVTFFMYSSKGLGFIRQALIVDRMDTWASDMLLAALALPNTITSIIIAGTIINSLLPIASRLYGKEEDSEQASAYLQSMLYILSGVLGLAALVAVIWIDPILRVMTSPDLIQDFTANGRWDMYLLTARILMMGPILFAVQGILSVFLQVKHRFFVYSLAGVIANLGILIPLLLLSRNSVIGASIGMMVGTCVSVGLHIWDAKTHGWHMFGLLATAPKQWFASKQHLLDTWKLFAPRMLMINGIVVANFLMVRFAQGSNGQVTGLDFALSIEEIFLTFIVSVSTVFFPNISSSIQRHTPGDQELWDQLRRYTRLVVVISLVGIALTWIIAPVIVWLLQLVSTGQIQSLGSYIVLLARIATIGLLFQSLSLLWSKFFHAKENSLLPVLLSVVASGAQVLFVIIFGRSGYDVGVIIILSLILNFFISFMGYGIMLWRAYNHELALVQAK